MTQHLPKISGLLLLTLLTAATALTACSFGGEEGICYGVTPSDGKDHCYPLTGKRACAKENRMWAPYLPGDKAQRHWESSGIRTCNAKGYESCGPGGCSRK